jgi:hypothetical protein
MANQESNSAQCAYCAARYRSAILRLSNSFYKTEIDMKSRLTKKLRCLREMRLTVSFRQQCMIVPENHALLPKAYRRLVSIWRGGYFRDAFKQRTYASYPAEFKELIIASI